MDVAQPMVGHTEAQSKTEAGQVSSRGKPGLSRSTEGGDVSPSYRAVLPNLCLPFANHLVSFFTHT